LPAAAEPLAAPDDEPVAAAEADVADEAEAAALPDAEAPPEAEPVDDDAADGFEAAALALELDGAAATEAGELAGATLTVLVDGDVLVAAPPHAAISNDPGSTMAAKSP